MAKQRFCNVANTTRATAEEWVEAFEKNGANGGSEGEEVDYNKEKEKVIAAQPELPPFDLNFAKQAKEDIWWTKRMLQTAARRKATVPWALPTEISKILTDPKYMTNPGRALLESAMRRKSHHSRPSPEEFADSFYT